MRRIGNVTFRADVSQAFPGGVVVVRLSSRGRLGAAWALLDGRRAPFYSERGVPRALVPVAASTEPGPATLGIGVASRGGEQRIAIPITIGAREYRSRYVYLSEEQRALASGDEVLRDARRLLAQLRTESKTPAPERFQPPVGRRRQRIRRATDLHRDRGRREPLRRAAAASGTAASTTASRRDARARTRGGQRALRGPAAASRAARW